MRVTVIGGGIIGLATAWRLAADRHAVTLIDAATEAREASWAAAGMLAPHHEAAEVDDLWRLGVDSLARWSGFVRELTGDAGALDHRQLGGFEPALDDGDDQRIEARRRLLDAAGIATRWLERAELAALEPGLAAPRALLIPGGQVDPRLATAALRADAGARGVDLRYGTAVTAIADDVVHLADGARIAHDQTVLASGAWTPALARLAGVDLAGEPVKGQLLRLQLGAGALTRFVHSRHAYLVPRGDGSVVVGASMIRAGFDRSDDPAVIAELAANARRLLPAASAAPITETWTGLRPRLAGGRPVIARVRPRLIVATGHFRNGILLTPVTAETVAALVAGAEPPAAARPFATAATLGTC
ncbi:MAG TPA: glycine oxidase ThiO [Planctomycetota bacterium]|nr:glycine oxidase ThiO [Planctomycetota bacterium]